jgi:hypothetical protein
MCDAKKKNHAQESKAGAKNLSLIHLFSTINFENK